MDFLNKAKQQMSSGGNTGAQQPAAGNVQGGAAGTEDYGDKGKLSSLLLLLSSTLPFLLWSESWLLEWNKC